MGIEQTAGIFIVGPKGRNINVNASGQIVTTEAGPLEVYGFGPKGRAIGVDANGRLGITVITGLEQIDSPGASGALDVQDIRQFDIILDKDVIWTEFSNPTDGSKYMLVLQQDSVGSRTVTWPSNVKWANGSAPTLTTAVSGIDVVTMVFRGRDDTFLADAGRGFD